MFPSYNINSYYLFLMFLMGNTLPAPCATRSFIHSFIHRHIHHHHHQFYVCFILITLLRRFDHHHNNIITRLFIHSSSHVLSKNLPSKSRDLGFSVFYTQAATAADGNRIILTKLFMNEPDLYKDCPAKC